MNRRDIETEGGVERRTQRFSARGAVQSAMNRTEERCFGLLFKFKSTEFNRIRKRKENKGSLQPGLHLPALYTKNLGNVLRTLRPVLHAEENLAEGQRGPRGFALFATSQQRRAKQLLIKLKKSQGNRTHMGFNDKARIKGRKTGPSAHTIS